MSLRQYFKPREGLPDPKGSLSVRIESRAIALANREVEKAIKEKQEKKRGPYTKFTPITAAAKEFSRRFKTKVNPSTVHFIKTAYLETKKKRRAEDDGDVSVLPCRKRGRPYLLGEELDTIVQLYLKKVREGGGVVSSRIAMAAARGIVLTYDSSKLTEFGGHIELNKSWAFSLLNRMKFVQRKSTTAKSKYTIDDFDGVKREFLDSVVDTVLMEDIPPELVLNWDQTGIKIVPVSPWTMDKQGSKRVEVTGVSDKRLITAVFCGSLTGDFLPLQVIYKGKTARCHPRYQFPSDWHITHSPRHWSTEKTMIEYIKEIIVPYVKSQQELLGEDKSALVIIDNFKGQVTAGVNKILEENDIHVCLLPPNTTDLLQPMDISVNKPAKDFMRKKFQEWYADQISKQLQGKNLETTELQPIDLSLPVLKEQGAKWLVEMAEHIAENPQFIVNGFIRSGIAAALDCIEQEGDDVDQDDRSETDESEEDRSETDESEEDDSETEESEEEESETEDEEDEEGGCRQR